MTTPIKPSVTEYIESLRGSRKYGPQVVHHKKLPEKEACFGKATDLHPCLQNYLRAQGIENLYSHQQEAVSAIKKGQDTMVATPTASGKTFIYNLPIFDALARGEECSALYLFPLKALARDQFDTISDLFTTLPAEVMAKYPLPAAIYDGDTSSYKRQKIKGAQPPVLLTNPEMLHLSLLPYHHNWQKFFESLKFVVIDEVHTYRGILGAHMAWVIRRLRRIAALYGADPVFILLSATIGNPQELGEKLVDKKVYVVDKSGSPEPQKNMLFLNPWEGAAFTACQLLEAAVKRGLRTIVYTQSRKITELVNMWTAPKLGELASKLSAYRAGFLPEERREIEEKLFSGQLLGVISTSALELGIDIGDLDICILVGYPGSVMATMQRGGRVGRGKKPSAIIMVAGEDALDQHFMRDPEDFFKRPPESAVLNPFNETIMDDHLHCMAAEKPIARDEAIVDVLEVQQSLKRLSYSMVLLENSEGSHYYATRKYPQRLVSLRGGGITLTIIDKESGEVVGEIDGDRARKECHPQAVYLHRGGTWLVDALHLEGREVVASRKNPHFYTKALTDKNTTIISTEKAKTSFASPVFFGKLRVSEQVTSFQKINKGSSKIIAVIPLDLEKTEFETEGLWLIIPRLIQEKMEAEHYHFMGAIHALEHAIIALFPLFVLCDRNDIGGISCPYHEQTEEAAIFVYDGHAGGVGLSKEAYHKIDPLLMEVQKTIKSCSCSTGCPSCVHSPKCGSGNRPIDKKACLYLVELLLKTRANFTPPRVEAKPRSTGVATISGLDLLPERYGVFDLETQYSAEEVGGWHNIEAMKMSLAVLYDSQLDEYVTYLEDEVEALVEHICQLDMVVGFNNIRFDNRVLAGYGQFKHERVPSLDLLQSIHRRLSYRLSLNRIAEATLGTEKTADGLQALAWYKEGRIDLIQKYCKKDVEITRQVFLHALEEEHLLFVNKAQKKVRLPLDLSQEIAALLKIT